ncbi:MAG: EVE domain-containing protein, partial [Calditrichaeota bacterium]|nr:EVE domain-containing protein [Calditrichota bacterium]
MTTEKHNYWIGVVSKSHVEIGLKGGFIQLNHGKKEPLQRMRNGDGFIFYSPRTEYPEGQILQHFTAVGIVKSGEIYQVEVDPDFKPYRLDVTFFKCNEMAIKPLLPSLSFIKDKTRWGAAFRFG